MKNFTLKNLSIERIENLILDRANRCGELDEEKAMKQGYSSSEHSQFISRAKKIAKDIIKNGWMEDSFFTVGRCITPGYEGLYLIDGQGRRGAIIILRNAGSTSNLPKEFIVHYYDNLTIDEIRSKMREMNSKPVTRWSCENKRSCEAKTLGGEFEKSYNRTKKFQDENGCGYYIAELFHFGEKATHSLSKSDVMLTSDDLIQDYEIFTDCYRKFVENAGVEYVKNGCFTEHARKKDYVTRTDIGIILFSLCKWNQKICQKYELDINHYLPEFFDRLIKKTNTTSTPSGKWKDYMKLNKKNKEEFAKGFRIKSIVSQLYANKENESIGDEVLRDFDFWTCGAYK